MAARYLTFDGERYTLHGYGRMLKSAAQRVAERLRREGYKVRVIRRLGGSLVYKRKA